MGNVLSSLLFVLPLGVDTFAIAAAVGASRLSGATRWRVSMVFVVCEGGMPLVGLALGASLGHTVGSVADYLSGGLLIVLGSYLWWADNDDDDSDDEVAKARRLTSARGVALVGLAVSISLDELAIGFSLGLGADVTTPATIVAAIVIQTLVVSQLGLSLGLRINERLRACIERITGPMLIVLGVSLLAGTLIHTGLVTARDAVIASTLVLVLGGVTVYCRYAARTPPTMPPQAQHEHETLTMPDDRFNEAAGVESGAVTSRLSTQMLR